jgi:hypothetical protein
VDDGTAWLVGIFAVVMGAALLVRALRPRRARREPEHVPAPAPTRPKSPRRQHYAFAHLVLRRVALSTPVSTWEALTSERAPTFLKDLWDSAKIGDGAVASDGLRASKMEDDIVVVDMPAPARAGEAYSAAIVRVASGDCAYFVLEKHGDHPTVAEYTLDARIGLGDVREATRAELLARVRSSMKKKPSIIICCPYCITPCVLSETTCITCGRDMTRDARVEYTIDEYADASRHACASCHEEMLDIAVTCPHCHAAVTA